MTSKITLESSIKTANDAYFNNISTARVSDEVYDRWKLELSKIDPTNELLDQVGAEPKEQQNKTVLPFWMGSMDKKTDERSISKFIETHRGPFVVSDKLDGVSALFVYNKRPDKRQLYTRGNGSVGQNISKTLLPLLKFPVSLDDECAVRGELIVSKQDFQMILKKKSFANPRNMVSGIVNSKLPDVNVAKYVRFVSYAVYHPRLDMKEQFSFLKRNHFETVQFDMAQSCSYSQLGERIQTRNAESLYEIDGLIVSSLPFENNSVGNPIHSFAFKSSSGQDFAIVTITRIEWHVSKDGLIKPVLIFPSVALNGVEIHRCTGFNAKYIVTNKLGAGAKIKLIRAGLVIPHCDSVVSASTTGQADLPDISFDWTLTGVDIKLVENTPELKLRLLLYFCERMSIVGLGKGVIKKLFEGGIDNPQKLFNVSEEELLKLPGFQKVSAGKIVSSIATAVLSAKDKCLVYMIASNSFGQGFGENKLRLITTAFPEIANPKSDFIPNMLDLKSIHGISSVTADSFLVGLAAWRRFMRKYKFVCSAQHIVSPLSVEHTSRFGGKNMVFTGIRDKILEGKLIMVGARIQDNITKDTDFLITKDEVDKETRKIQKAKEQGVTVMKMSELRMVCEANCQ